MSYKLSNAYKIAVQFLNKEQIIDLNKYVESNLPNYQQSSLNKWIENFFGYLPHLFTLSNIRVIDNTGGESKSINGKISMSNSCMWISIRDYLRMNGYPNITALQLKQESGLDPIHYPIHPANSMINNVHGMWHYEYQEHIDSLIRISNKYNIKILVHYIKRDRNNNILLSNRPLEFGNKSNPVHIISYGAHFELITHYIDIITNEVYEIKKINYMPNEMELSNVNGGITIKSTKEGFMFEHTKVFSESIQDEINRISRELEDIIHKIEIKNGECTNGHSVIDVFDNTISELDSKLLGIRKLRCNFIRERKVNADKLSIAKNIKELETMQEEISEEKETYKKFKKQMVMQIHECRVEFEKLISEGEKIKEKINNLEKNKEEIRKWTDNLNQINRKIKDEEENIKNIKKIKDLSNNEIQQLLDSSKSITRNLVKEKDRIKLEIEKILNK